MIEISTGNKIPEIPDNIPEQLSDLIKYCLTRDASKRPTAEELLKHKFLQ